jgi:TPR repeat protein
LGSNIAQFILWNELKYMDGEQAIAWLKKSAENGYAKAQNELGNIYYEGSDIHQDYKQAQYWWYKSAEQGNNEAQANLGCLYCGRSIQGVLNWRSEKDVPIDLNKAKFWLEKASSQKNQKASLSLATLYSKGLDHYIENFDLYLLLIGTDDKYFLQDLNKAFLLYKESAESGDVYSQCVLGGMYQYGLGGTMVALDKAIYWYKKASINGDHYASFLLGELYFDSSDYEMAFYWFLKDTRIQSGWVNGASEYMVGYMYNKGIGTLMNKQLAVSWYIKSAKQGYSKAQILLGYMYLLGEDIKRDKKEAAYWIKKAYDNGYEEAKEVWEEYELWKYL